MPYVDKSKSECLNEADEHPYVHCLSAGGGYLESDCDEQLILSLSFNQVGEIQDNTDLTCQDFTVWILSWHKCTHR